jgi:hypothetical protein
MSNNQAAIMEIQWCACLGLVEVRSQPASETKRLPAAAGTGVWVPRGQRSSLGQEPLGLEHLQGLLVGLWQEIGQAGARREAKGEVEDVGGGAAAGHTVYHVRRNTGLELVVVGEENFWSVSAGQNRSRMKLRHRG